MLAASTMFGRALAAPHRVISIVDLWYGGELVYAGLPYVSGGVRATLTSRVARTMDLTLPASFMPTGPDDMLTPFGPELRAWRGIRMGTEDELLPVFRGRVQSVVQNEGGLVAVQSVDRAGDLADADFETPRTLGADVRLHDAIKQLILEVQPDATFATFTVPDLRLPELTWEDSRVKALDDLTAGAGGLWYPLADGAYVARPVPWTTAATPVLTLSDGDGGAIRSSRWGYERQGVYNSVVVSGERTDGTEPSVYIARDESETSPTRFDGPFGLRTLQYRSQTAVTGGEARTIAETLLRRGTSRREVWSVSVIPDPRIELGDCVELHAKGRTATQVVSGFSMPLGVGDMSLTLRALQPEGEAVV